MIDFGLISLFAIQLGLVAVTYHFFLSTKSENKRIKTAEDRMNALDLLFRSLQIKFDDVSTVPKKMVERISDTEAIVLGVKNDIEALQNKQASLSAKISANARWAKAKEEQGPTSEEEPEQELIFPTPSAPENSIPKTFGKLPTRRVING